MVFLDLSSYAFPLFSRPFSLFLQTEIYLYQNLPSSRPMMCILLSSIGCSHGKFRSLWYIEPWIEVLSYLGFSNFLNHRIYLFNLHGKSICTLPDVSRYMKSLCISNHWHAVRSFSFPINFHAFQKSNAAVYIIWYIQVLWGVHRVAQS